MREYVLTWIHEEEKWYYAIDERTMEHEHGCVDYYVCVNDDGIITHDELNELNEGKKFSEAYDISLWKSTCLNCSHEQELKQVYKDELGSFTVCENCESSYDI